MAGSRTRASACRIYFGDPSRETSSWKTEEERDFRNFDFSVRWWMELIENWVKWRTFLIDRTNRSETRIVF